MRPEEEIEVPKFVVGLLTLVATLIVSFAFYILFRSVMASGEDAFCFVSVYSPDGMAPQYKLIAWRDWRSDRQIGIYPSVEEARKAAESLGCKLGHH